MRLAMLEVKRLMTAMVAVAAVAACSGGDDDPTPPLTPTIDIALSAAALSVVQGASGTANVTLTRGSGFTGPVTIAVTGAPTGVTATPAPTPIPTGSTSSVITIAVGAAAVAATTNLTVTASGTGVTSKTQTLALTVTAAPAASYTIAVAPATVSVAQGGTGTETVTLTRTGGFAGAVALTAEGLPTGVTAAFNPASVTANTSTMTLTVGAAAAAGTSTITVRGTATGQTDKTATFTLTITAAPAGTYTLAVTPATVSVAQGATGTANVALTRTGGFTGAVALTAEGLPTGVTGAFNPASATADASVLTLTVGAAAAAGNSTITVRGTATGQTDKTATFVLTVTAAPAGGYTLSLTPTALTVQQGANGTTTVTLTRTGGFVGAVALTATGLPTGVTAAFNPASATATTSTLTLTAAANAALGAATVTIRGNATGTTEQTATLALTVTAATGGSGNTTWEFCSTAETPIWLAIQDGTGAWTRVTPTGTRFQFNIAGGRGGVAFVLSTTSPSVSASRALARRMSSSMQTALLMQNKAVAARTSAYAARASSRVDGFDLNIFYGTQAELNSQGTSQCVAGTGKTVNGSVAGIGAQQTAFISLGDAAASVTGGAGTTFQLTSVPDGALDLIGSRSTLTISGTSFTSTVDKLIIRRGLNQANNSTIPVLDFNAAEAFAPAEANIAVGNLGTDQATIFTSFFTNSTSGATLFTGFTSGAGPFKYYGVPLARQQTGDLHFAFVTSFPPGGTTIDNARFTGLYFKDPTDRTVTLGAVLPAQTVSVAATTPYVRFRATGPLPAAYNKYVSATFTQATTTVVRAVFIGASAGYLNNATTYDLTVPDFSGVAGWDNNWGPKVGVATQWTVSGFGFTGIGVNSPNPVEGSTFQGALRAGTITP